MKDWLELRKAWVCARISDSEFIERAEQTGMGRLARQLVAEDLGRAEHARHYRSANELWHPLGLMVTFGSLVSTFWILATNALVRQDYSRFCRGEFCTTGCSYDGMQL
jgi:hypothetical protein